MRTLLERLNASRRFARSVYAPHKLGLRQGVPSALRAVGVTAPAPQVSSAARSLAPRVIGAAAPVVARGVAVPASAVQQPNPSAAANPAALEPQGLPSLEPQAVASLGLQSLSTLESPLEDTGFAAAPLEVAAPARLAPSEPMLELDDTVIANPPLEHGSTAPPAHTFFDQPVADPDPIGAQAGLALEPSALANAPVVRAVQGQVMAEQPVSPPISRATPQATPLVTTAPLEPVGAEPELARQNEPVAQTSPELSRIADASAMAKTLAAAPVQPLEGEGRAATAEPISLEPPVVAADLEVLPGAPATSQPMVNDPFTKASVSSEPGLLEVLQAPPVPEVIAPSVTAPVSLEVAAPSVAAPPAADQSASSPDPLQTTLRGRVVEEFQARPPRNMPLRNVNLRGAEPEAAPQASPSDTSPTQTPLRSPEEWVRLLRQRFPQPGDEAFDDPVTPSALPEFSRLETSASVPATASPASLEPARAAAATLPSADASMSGTPAVASTESEPLSASTIRERSQAALQAIPEDMSQRTPRDWGLALIRRYTSADEAAAIGIEAYRDPNDPTPISAPAQAAPSQTARTVASRTTIPSTASSSSKLAAPMPLEPVASSARRFVAPGMALSSAPRVTSVTSASVGPSQAGAVQTQPTAPQRSSAPLGQFSDGLGVAPLGGAQLGQPPSIAADSAIEAPLQSTLETEGFAAPPTEAEPVAFEHSQMARAAFSQRPASDAWHGSDFAPNIAQRDTPQLDVPATTPTLEPVSLSGATRRFLEPLVGFDPSEISVYSGETASRVTRDLRADAAAQHGAVLLPDASNLETPAQLGLLAHELIHAAQQQSAGAPQPDAAAQLLTSAQPLLETPRSSAALRRFVPAVGSADTRSAAQTSNAVRQSRAPVLSDLSSFASQEQQAQVAEARAVQIARAESLSADPTIPNAAPSWNGLPAPWESLPSFESPSSDEGVVSLIGTGLSPQGWGGSATTTTNPAGYGASVSSSSAGSSGAGSGASSGTSASSAAQAAQVGRGLPEASGASAAAPDLEQLAKQVYDVLKRRLQSDRSRRGGP